MNLLKFLPKKIIYREDGQQYLIRYTLFNFFGLFKIRLHHILLSDADCVHDHPWAFISVILKGGYYEWLEFETSLDLNKYDPRLLRAEFKYVQRGNWMYAHACFWRRPGTVLFRRAKDRHRLELAIDYDGPTDPIYVPCWSLVIMFKKTRLWGFWTKLGFTPWFNYSSNQNCD